MDHKESKEEQNKRWVREAKRGIVHNILQAVRLKLLGYHVDDDGNVVLLGHDDTMSYSDYYRDKAMSEGEWLLRHHTKEIDTEVNDENTE